MPLTNEQRALLTEEAKKRGLDPDKLIAAAERGSEGSTGKPATTAGVPGKEKPNLYMYLLPFVTVNEVRTIWLELDPVAGGEQYAGEWAAKQGGVDAPAADPDVE